MIPMLAEVSYSFGMLSDVCSKLKILMQGPLSTTFPIENRNVPVTAKALKNHLDRTKNLPFVKRISDFHLLLLLARFLDISADVPALAECVSRQVPVPDGYKLLIESVASSSWDDQVACEASDTNCRFQPNRSDEVKYQLLISSGDILGPRYEGEIWICLWTVVSSHRKGFIYGLCMSSLHVDKITDPSLDRFVISSYLKSSAPLRSNCFFYHLTNRNGDLASWLAFFFFYASLGVKQLAQITEKL